MNLLTLLFVTATLTGGIQQDPDEILIAPGIEPVIATNRKTLSTERTVNIAYMPFDSATYTRYSPNQGMPGTLTT